MGKKLAELTINPKWMLKGPMIFKGTIKSISFLWIKPKRENKIKKIEKNTDYKVRDDHNPVKLLVEGA